MRLSIDRGALATGLALLLVGCGSSLPSGEAATGGTGGGNRGEWGAICNQIAPDGATFSVCRDAASDQGGNDGKGGKGGLGGSESGPVDATFDLPPAPVGAE
jgi:hypothetical protein